MQIAEGVAAGMKARQVAWLKSKSKGGLPPSLTLRAPDTTAIGTEGKPSALLGFREGPAVGAVLGMTHNCVALSSSLLRSLE